MGKILFLLHNGAAVKLDHESATSVLSQLGNKTRLKIVRELVRAGDAGFTKTGMSPGAAMAFITSGAVSSIPAALAVYALVRKSVFVLYILIGLFGSMLAGYFFQIFVSV